MTACKDSLSGKKAVSATLAGVLAVGMVPAAAFAETAQADTNDEQGVELLTGEASQDFANGHITATGADWSNTDKEWDVTADGTAKKLTITAVVTKSGQTVTIDNKYTVKYYAADADGEITTTEVASPTEVGTYYVTVTGTDKAEAYAGASITEKFVIKANDQAFESMKAGAPSKDGKTVDTTAGFTYTAEEQEVGFTLGKANAEATALEAGKDYEVTYYKAKGNLDSTTQLSGAPVDAGDYIASVKGLGQYAGVTKNLKVTVNALDLHAQTVAYAGITTTSASAPTALEGMTVGGKDASDALVSQLKLTFADTTKDYFGTNGSYTFAVEPADSNNKNFIGAGATFDASHKGSVTVTKVGKLATFKYGKKALAESYDLDKSAEDYVAFDPDNIKAYNGTTAITDGVTKTYYYKDNEGKWVLTPAVKGEQTAAAGATAPDFTQAGSYKVVTTVLTNGSKVGGSAETVVNVTEGAVDADASVYVIYKGVATTSVSEPYTTAGIAKTAITAKGEAVDAATGTKVTLSTDATDAKLKLDLTFKDSEGEKVTASALTKPGEYTVEVSSKSYKLTGTTSVKVTINPVDLSVVKIPTSDKGNFVAKGTTVDAFKDGLKYNTGVKAGKSDGDADGKGYDVIFGKAQSGETKATTNGFQGELESSVEMKNSDGEWVAATDLSAEGDYRVTVKVSNKDNAANYKFADEGKTVVEFKVVDPAKVKFDDVTSDSWAFDAVAAVSKGDGFAGYMNGYNGTKIFGANDTITRGQVACVLFNLAGGETDHYYYGGDNSFSEIEGYKSFDDVNGKMYYGKAIAWAKQTGVVNGYADGTFRPDQPVTREEFACMLANYAQKTGAFKASDGSALAKLADAGQVSAWAKDSVAWAVENKLMGNGGTVNPSANITRAETACMVYNYAKANKLTLDE